MAKKQNKNSEDVGRLLKQLEKADDPGEKRKLRMLLRKAGHQGGLGKGGGRPPTKDKATKSSTTKAKGKRVREPKPAAEPIAA